jgi:urease accessory protein
MTRALDLVQMCRAMCRECNKHVNATTRTGRAIANAHSVGPMTRCRALHHVSTSLLGAFVASVVSAAPVGAHSGGATASFGDGALHPIGGPDHLLAMLAVGILAVVGTRVDRRFLWAAPVTFVTAMVVGGAAGFVGIVDEPFELVIVGSVAAIGVATVLVSRASTADRRPIVLAAAVALVACAGMAHGDAHGAEAAAGTNALGYVAGFVAVTIGLHALGAGLAATVRARPSLATSLGLIVTAAGVVLVV